jgi:GNAT superfamily N-acetyltransferase
MLKGFVYNVIPGTFDYDRDIPWICRELMESEWGIHLTEEKIKRAMRASHNFGIYLLKGGNMHITGFARVVSDQALFSSITDFIITKEARGHSLGRQLLEHVLAHDCVRQTECVIHTSYAAPFYAKFGFKPHKQGVMIRAGAA